LAGETILVCDDADENRAFIQEYVLEPNGYQTLMARDGKEGLDMAIKYRPDLILLDYNMPRMDGIEVLKSLVKRNLSIPVILMTFYGSEDIAVEVFRLGVRDYIAKPFYPEDMERAIDKALTEVRLRQERDALTERVMQSNRELQYRLQELNVLYGIGKHVTSLIKMEQLMPRLVDAAVQITRAEQGYIYLLEGNRLVCRAQREAGSSRSQSAARVVKEPAAMRVIRTGQPVLISPAANSGHSLASSVFVPLIAGKRLIGVLGVKNTSPGAGIFTQHDSALLSALSDYAAIAITNSHNYEALRRAKEKEKESIRGTFERFVAPSVVEKVLQHPDSLQLGGTRQEISVLFADIRGYTSWSENAAPEQVVETLNQYLSMAAEVILAWEGTLDKFFGDGLMAIFNAPEPQPDHVHRAADAALAMMKAANEVSARHGHKLAYSIGVNVGEAVVGYIGTDRAVNYTAIGDVVNLTKRLQENAAPGQILVDEAVIARLGSLVEARPLGEMTVKGRQQGVRVSELSGLRYPSSI
jgi:class 3 adenylate cyclase/CheY-like chemotaxis protein